MPGVTAEEKKRIEEENEKLYKEAIEKARSTWKLRVSDKTIGKGGFSRVFLAEDEKGKLTALKFCILKTRSEREREYLLREVEVQKNLHHPNLVALYRSMVVNGYDENEKKEIPFYVIIQMEYCPLTLNQYVEQFGEKIVIPSKLEGRKDEIIHVLDENKLRPFARDALKGLLYLNRMGYPHRDIKGENILMYRQEDDSYVAKLADFGMVKPAEEGLCTRLGTPQYMPPEVVKAFDSGESYDLRCDIWSFGVTFYKILVGSFPFDRKNLETELRRPEPKFFSLPSCPRGSSKPFSSMVKHFIQCLLTKNFQHRLTSEQTLRHPYLMPYINYVQFLAPDVSMNVMVSRNHLVDSGQLAFDNVERKVTLSKLLSMYPCNEINWSLTWQDVAEKMHMTKTDDLLVIRDGGRIYGSNDKVEIGDDMIPVIFVPKQKPIAGIDPSVLVQSGMDTVANLSKRKDDGETLQCYIKELNTRYHFCLAADRLNKMVRPLLKFDWAVKQLMDEQRRIYLANPLFPLVAFVPPSPAEWPVLSEEVRSEAFSLRKAIEDCHKTGRDKSRKPNPDFSPEIKELRGLADKWIKGICPSMEEAIKCFSRALDIIRESVSIIGVLYDYNKLLKSVGDNPTAIYQSISKLIQQCPCLHPNQRSKKLLKDEDVISGREDDEIRRLKEQIQALTKIYLEEKKQTEEISKNIEAIQKAAGDAIQAYKREQRLLLKALSDNQIPLPAELQKKEDNQ